LYFERCFSIQNSVIRLKSNILAPTNFWAGYATAKNTKVQFVLRYTKRGTSSTESLIINLKSKHRIQVILESDDHNTIPAQEEI